MFCRQESLFEALRAAMANNLLRRAGRSLTIAVVLGLVSAAPALADFGFCPTFTSCTAGLLSQASVDVRSHPVVVVSRDDQQTATNATVTATVGNCNAPICGGSGGFAQAAAQSDFGLNRAVATAGPGSSAVGTQAIAISTWEDVLSFSGDGRAHADVSLDGVTGITGDRFPGGPTGSPGGPNDAYNAWSYDLTVFDLSDLVPDDTPDREGSFVPRVVGGVSAGASLVFGSFADTRSLDFDFLAGDTYFVIAKLYTTGSEGSYADLFNTVRLGSLQLSDGANLSALSGHDYVAAATSVPEPEVVTLMLCGLALFGVRRRRARQRSAV